LFKVKPPTVASVLMLPLSIAHASSPPAFVPRCCKIGPGPPARTIDQMKKIVAVIGTKYALTVIRCRIWCTGNQIAGRDKTQNITKDM
jgi:hypothetical protein